MQCKYNLSLYPHQLPPLIVLIYYQPTNPSGASLGTYSLFRQQNMHTVMESQLSYIRYLDATNPAELKSLSASAEVAFTLIILLATTLSNVYLLEYNFHHSMSGILGAYSTLYMAISRSTYSSPIYTGCVYNCSSASSSSENEHNPFANGLLSVVEG